MPTDVAFLLSFLYHNRIIKAAVSIDKKLLSRDVFDYLSRGHHWEELRKFLPAHVASLGQIIDVEQLFNVSIYKPEQETA